MAKTTKKRGRPKKELKKPKKKVKPVPKPVPKPKPARYFEAVGRRKTAVARVRLFTKGEKEFLVNDKSYQVYFPTPVLQQAAMISLEKMKCLDKFRISAKVRGGGLNAQAEAVRHGIARALVLFNPDFRKRLKKVGFLTRDPRMRERKKFGLKRARRAPQWKKR
jgi:small subunit ribosomal protein S9